MAPLAVLGIDAAWTAQHASGVALVAREACGWRCLSVAPSYTSFREAAARESRPDPPALLARAETLLGGPFRGVIAVDMPLATEPITRRRAADNAISRTFGARGCGVHSPTAGRPGPISDGMREGFATLGFPLATATTPVGLENRVLEVYPHLAVMALLGEQYRVPYKLGRARQYWSDATPETRVLNLRTNWTRILGALGERISSITLELPARASKQFEDALDALVCAWIGMEFLEGRAAAYGDDTAAIWAPTRAQGAGA